MLKGAIALTFLTHFKAHNSEWQNLPFPLQMKPVKVS